MSNAIYLIIITSIITVAIDKNYDLLLNVLNIVYKSILKVNVISIENFNDLSKKNSENLISFFNETINLCNENKINRLFIDKFSLIDENTIELRMKKGEIFYFDTINLFECRNNFVRLSENTLRTIFIDDILKISSKEHLIYSKLAKKYWHEISLYKRYMKFRSTKNYRKPYKLFFPKFNLTISDCINDMVKSNLSLFNQKINRIYF